MSMFSFFAPRSHSHFLSLPRQNPPDFVIDRPRHFEPYEPLGLTLAPTVADK